MGRPSNGQRPTRSGEQRLCDGPFSNRPVGSLAECILCPHSCKVDRLKGAAGPCGVAGQPVISKVRALFHEETCISGTRGSGAVFLTGCTQACVFCQNFDFNLECRGETVGVEALAATFLNLQRGGCHNIHWISPTHQVPWLVEALHIARQSGLVLPIVYNTGGYERVEVLRALEGLVDIYLPDFKLWSEEASRRLLRTPGYPDAVRQAILEMKRQVGNVQIDRKGIALRGLLVRHLVMPGHLQDSARIFDWLATKVGEDTFVNVMPFYQPLYRAERHEEINRRILPQEWHKAMDLARQAGLKNLVSYDIPVDATNRELAIKVAAAR